MKCKKCGNEIKDNSKYCSECGEKIENTNSTSGEYYYVPNNAQHEKNKKASKNTNYNESKGKGITFWDNMTLFCKICVGYLIVLILLLNISLLMNKGISIFISTFQIVGIITAILMDKNKITGIPNWIKYVILGVAVLLIFVNVKGLAYRNTMNDNYDYEVSEEEEKVLPVNIPLSSDDVIGKNYLDIEDLFVKNGFKNVMINSIEDVSVGEVDKVGTIESITVNGENSFIKDDIVNSDVDIIINYHDYKKYNVNIHVNFIPNLIFSKYDVVFSFDYSNEKTISHGEDTDFSFEVKPGEYTIKFVSEEDDDVNGEIKLKVNGDTNVSYSISCYSDKVLIEEEYLECPDAVGEDEIMMPGGMEKYTGKNYKKVKKELKKLGFTKIKTEIVYDIVFGITDEGDTDSVSINGKKTFKRGDIFSKDDPVVIIYHMKEEDDPDKKKTESSNEKNVTEEDESEESVSKGNDGPVFYSTNNYEDAKKGNAGVFSYVRKMDSYNMYYIIDFEEGYVYSFVDNDSSCERYKIETGTLNDALKYTLHDGDDVASYILHFKYKNHPETLILYDNNGFDFKYTTTDLQKALELRDERKIHDY